MGAVATEYYTDGYHGRRAASAEQSAAYDLQFYSTKAAIDIICAALTDRQAVEVARKAMMKPNGRASAFLDHYLKGGGKPWYIDIRELLKEDAGVRTRVHAVITRSIADGKFSGVVPIGQTYFSNHDWCYATGSINMNWMLDIRSAKLPGLPTWLHFRNVYRWHPNEGRISQSIHQALERLKAQGAREFDMIGQPVLVEVAHLVPKARPAPNPTKTAEKATVAENETAIMK